MVYYVTRRLFATKLYGSFVVVDRFFGVFFFICFCFFFFFFFLFLILIKRSTASNLLVVP